MIQPRLIGEAFPRPYLLAFVQENHLAQLVLGKSIDNGNEMGYTWRT